MKIRIKGNSIRIRLTQSEPAGFGAGEMIEDFTEFGLAENERLTFILQAKTNVEQISAQFENGKISINVPHEVAATWSKSEQVGLSNEQILSPEKRLKILVEKDFTCLVPRTNGDDKDTFPHPKTEKIC